MDYNKRDSELESLIDEFIKKLDESGQYKIEASAPICKNEQGIELGDFCLGEERSCSPSNCGSGKPIGSIHSHGKIPWWANIDFSPFDVAGHLASRNTVRCVTGIKHYINKTDVIDGKETVTEIKPTYETICLFFDSYQIGEAEFQSIAKDIKTFAIELRDAIAKDKDEAHEPKSHWYLRKYPRRFSYSPTYTNTGKPFVPEEIGK